MGLGLIKSVNATYRHSIQCSRQISPLSSLLLPRSVGVATCLNHPLKLQPCSLMYFTRVPRTLPSKYHNGVSSSKLTMKPQYLRTSKDAQSISFTCNADAALAGCQFTWWDHVGRAGPLLDLSRGPKFQANERLLDNRVTDYSYSGRGLGLGDCGVSLEVEGKKAWILACRVRAHTGAWRYAWGELYAEAKGNLPSVRTPREVVVFPGKEARFTFRVRERLRYCRFFLAGSTVFYPAGLRSEDNTGRHHFVGAGLERGECGLALDRVSYADNGPISGYIRNAANTKSAHRFMALIVARPPTPPTLSVVYTHAGVRATCVVSGGRPAANITWILGYDVVRQDSRDETHASTEDKWRWPWQEGTVLQTYMTILDAKDQGKVLKCVASHVALASPLEKSVTISFPHKERSPSIRHLAIPRHPAISRHRPIALPVHRDNSTEAAGTKSKDALCRGRKGIRLLTCLKKEVNEFHARKVKAAAMSAELLEAHERVKLQHARASLVALKSEVTSNKVLARMALKHARLQIALARMTLRTATSIAKAEEARARGEEAWAKNAEEQLQYERNHRKELAHNPQGPSG